MAVVDSLDTATLKSDSHMKTFFGIDPGGKGNFGWCVIEVDEMGSKIERLSSGTKSSIGEVLSELARATHRIPLGAGIDAPLFWRLNGERKADQEIRKAVNRAGGHPATVGHINSLRGACLVQGVLAAISLAKLWPEIQITESHPKALLVVKPDSLALFNRINFGSDHERDAALGAYSALCHRQRSPGWRDWVESEEAPIFPSGGRVAYWFPCADSGEGR